MLINKFAIYIRDSLLVFAALIGSVDKKKLTQQATAVAQAVADGNGTPRLRAAPRLIALGLTTVSDSAATQAPWTR
jgi:hypothetical protein